MGPSVKSLALFPRILRMLDANLDWTEQLGEAYLADPAAVMDAVQRLRRRAQSAGRLVTTSQEIVRTEQEPARIEESITIEAPSPEVVYVPICDPSFAYGPWPYPDFPAFFPVFAGATLGGCGWISGPIIVPFVLNFRTRHIEIDRKRLALFDRDLDRERDRDHPLGGEWRHDPGHRATFPTAMRRSAPGLGAERQRRTSILLSADAGRTRLVSGVPLRSRRRKSGDVLGWRAPDYRLTAVGFGPRGSGPLLKGGGPQPLASSPASEASNRRWRALIRPSGRSLASARSRLAVGGQAPSALGRSTARFGGVQPALEGLDPTESRTPDGQSPDRDAEKRMLIEQELAGRVPPNALAPPLDGLRASPSFGGIGSTQSLGDRRSTRPLVGIGARPSGGREPGAIGAPPFSSKGPQKPSGSMGAGGGRQGRQPNDRRRGLSSRLEGASGRTNKRGH